MQQMTTRGRAGGLVAVDDGRRAGAERAAGLPVDRDALLAASGAVAHGQDLLVPARERPTVDVAEPDDRLLASTGASAGVRTPERARPERRARVGLQPALAHEQGEADRGRQRALARHLRDARPAVR